MPRGKRRKIEVPTDTQPQFELGDTAEDIVRRRREREERDERERREQEERARERMERERREESQERGEKRVRTDTDTDVESTQSRQKKGQMKSIFLNDSDEEASSLNSSRNFLTRPTTVSKISRRKNDFAGNYSSYQKLAYQDCEEVV